MSNCYVQLSHHGGHESHIAVATRNMFHVCLTNKSAKRVSLFWYVHRTVELGLE